MTGTNLLITMNNPWVIGAVTLFILLLIYSLYKFFGLFFDFIQAKGCLTVGLIAIVGLPGIFILSLVTGNTIASTFLIIFAVIGVITGYIARDAEGNVGKFGNFIMIVSLITLVVAIILFRILSKG
jgi:FtsH-binding integral membrane protein